MFFSPLRFLRRPTFFTWMVLVLTPGTSWAQFWEGQWIIFDPGTQAYLPYSPGTHQSNSLSFVIDPDIGSGKSLEVCAEEGSSLLVESNLIYYFEKTGCWELAVDDLATQYAKNRILLTIYHKDLRFSPNYSYSIKDSKVINDSSGTNFELIPIARSENQLRDFFVLGTVIVLLFLAGFFKFQRRAMRGYYDLGGAISLRPRSNLLQSFRVFERTNLLVMLFHSLLVAFVVVLAVSSRPDWASYLPQFSTHRLDILLMYWVLIAAITFSFYVLKLGVIAQMSTLFGLKEFKDQHFLDYLRLSMIFFLGFFILLITLNLATVINNPQWVSAMLDGIGLFMIARVLLIFLKLNFHSPSRNLHHISYLCSTEILPLVFILKLFV